MLSLFRSLCLSTLLSFAMPVILTGLILVVLYAVNYIPGFTWVSEIGTNSIWKFLAVFGSGCPLQGMMTIGFTFAFVGSLFDLFNFSILNAARGLPAERSLTAR